jgi:hypothetical protein
MQPNSGLPSISDDPKLSKDDDASKMEALIQRLVGIFNDMSNDEKSQFLDAISASSNQAQDDEETGNNPNASNKERNALGVDEKARRIAVDKAIRDTAAFETRWGSRIKIDTMGVK